jgi:hypothetical protein
LNRYDGESTAYVDDTKTFTLLHVWTRDNEQGNLQLIEMDTNGFVLRMSDPSKPYYKCVNNEYPFYFGRMMPKLGHFYGTGDGKLLKYPQLTLNRLTDELEMAARHNAQPKTYVDPRANMDLDQFDSDPSHPIIAENPQQNVYVVPGTGINPVTFNMIDYIQNRSQLIVRFSDIMTGNQRGTSATATQISGQLAQGSVGINDKKAEIEQAMAWADRYCLQLCLEKWDVPFWSSIDGKEFEYIDTKDFAQAPAVVPLSEDSAEDLFEKHQNDPNYNFPEYETVTTNGETELIDLDFDVTVHITNSIPKGRVEQYNQLLGLMQIQIPNPQTGMLEPFMDIDLAREEMERITGFKLTKEREQEEAPPPDMGSLLNTANAINPISGNGNVQMPQGAMARGLPNNLSSTVPGAAGMDKRGMQL